MTTRTFGPWTTSLDSGSQMELSAFWKQRLRRLDGLRSGSPRRSIASVLLIGVAVGTQAVPLLRGGARPAFPVLAAAIAQEQKANPPGSPSTPQLVAEGDRRIHASLQLPTDVFFSETALEDALNYLKDYHHISLHIDREGLKTAGVELEAPVTSTTHNVSFQSVLKLLLEPLQLDWLIKDGTLVITARDAAQRHVNEWEYDVRIFTQAGFPPRELAKVLQETVTPSAWESAGGDGSLRIEMGGMYVKQTRQTRVVLDELLREMDWALDGWREPADTFDRTLVTKTYRIEDLRGRKSPVLETNPQMTDEDLAAALRRYVDPGSWREQGGTGQLNIEGGRLLVKQTDRGQAALSKLLDGVRGGFQSDFDAPMKEDHLRSAAIAIAERQYRGRDRRAARRAIARPRAVEFSKEPLGKLLTSLEASSQVRIQIDERSLAGAGIDASLPITIRREDVPLSAILDEVLLPVKLDWALLADGSVRVMTDAAAAVTFETRAYGIKPILAAGMTPQTLTDRITTAIEPATWSARGGKAIVHVFPGVLIVAHNRRVQERVDRLLVDLEGQK